MSIKVISRLALKSIKDLRERIFKLSTSMNKANEQNELDSSSKEMQMKKRKTE